MCAAVRGQWCPVGQLALRSVHLISSRKLIFTDLKKVSQLLDLFPSGTFSFDFIEFLKVKGMCWGGLAAPLVWRLPDSVRSPTSLPGSRAWVGGACTGDIPERCSREGGREAGWGRGYSGARRGPAAQRPALTLRSPAAAAGHTQAWGPARAVGLGGAENLHLQQVSRWHLNPEAAGQICFGNRL